MFSFKFTRKKERAHKFQLNQSARISLHLSIIFTVWTLWCVLAPAPAFSYITEYWQVTVTMIFGSLIAGGTSEGGGAVAFPVFTKILEISPHTAKVFSLAIQSVGMTAASLAIFLMRVPVERRALLLISLGGIPGIAIGSLLIAPLLPPAVIRITFTAMLSGFAVTLIILNRGIRSRNEKIPLLKNNENFVLLAAGIPGGIISGLVGNGIDIFAFSLLVLLFRVSEKVATPTSVILMAINALAGFLIHVFFLGDFTEEVQNYWLAAVPVVVVGAPLGALLCRYVEAKTIAAFLIFLIGVELITSIVLIPLTLAVIVSGMGTFFFYFILYYGMYRYRFYEQSLPGLGENSSDRPGI